MQADGNFACGYGFRQSHLVLLRIRVAAAEVVARVFLVKLKKGRYSVQSIGGLKASNKIQPQEYSRGGGLDDTLLNSARRRP